MVGSARCAAAVKPLVRKVVEGVRVGQAPKLEKEGHGGTYFFKDAAGNYVALVKPTDEEPLAPNNPKVAFLPSHRETEACNESCDLMQSKRPLCENE